MKAVVPISKQSKREQKAYHSKQRNTWEGISPVTRMVPNKRSYDRKRERQMERRNDLHNW